jgi:hypothetical protein
MRTFWKWAVVLAIPAIWVAGAGAQQPLLPNETTAKLLLLRQKSVQKELKISADVVEKIMAFTEEEAEAAGKALQMAKAQRKKAFAQLEEKNKMFLADTLNEKQNTRLNQITLQFTATYQLTKPKAAKTLDLTEDQVQKFKDLHAEYTKEVVNILFGKDIEDRAAKYAKLREQMRTKILGILTEQQQAKARELAGPPFTGEIVLEEYKLRKKK